MGVTGLIRLQKNETQYNTDSNNILASAKLWIQPDEILGMVCSEQAPSLREGVLSL